MKFYTSFSTNKKLILTNQDCLETVSEIPDDYLQLAVTSPPYFIGKQYDTSKSVKDFEELHIKLFDQLIRKIRLGGSICWQVGYHVNNNCIYPLDYLIFKLLTQHEDLYLRNRIIWTYGHGLHTQQRYSGRHEVILWFSKGKDYKFNLDDVRVPQKVPR